jgi:hypothetical protein
VVTLCRVVHHQRDPPGRQRCPDHVGAGVEVGLERDLSLKEAPVVVLDEVVDRADRPSVTGPSNWRFSSSFSSVAYIARRATQSIPDTTGSETKPYCCRRIASQNVKECAKCGRTQRPATGA